MEIYQRQFNCATITAIKTFVVLMWRYDDIDIRLFGIIIIWFVSSIAYLIVSSHAARYVCLLDNNNSTLSPPSEKQMIVWPSLHTVLSTHHNWVIWLYMYMHLPVHVLIIFSKLHSLLMQRYWCIHWYVISNRTIILVSVRILLIQTEQGSYIICCLTCRIVLGRFPVEFKRQGSWDHCVYLKMTPY